MLTMIKKRSKTPLDPIELEFIANEAIENYIQPNFDLDLIDFELLSTIRYDPLLDLSQAGEEYYSDDDEKDKPVPQIPNTEYIINETSELIAENEDREWISSAQFFLFDEHLHRIKLSLFFFKWDFQTTKGLLLGKLNEALQHVDHNLPYKCRVLISKTGELKIEVVPIPISTNLMEGLFVDTPPDHMWSVYIDTSPIPVSPFTSFKTTKRDHYTQARSRSLPTNKSLTEVLVYNEARQVMEGSITNIAFRRIKIYPGSGKIIERWVTPPLSSGCLCGVTRHMLISKNLIEEEPIKLAEVQQGEEVLLFNGIIGVVKGRIV